MKRSKNERRQMLSGGIGLALWPAAVWTYLFLSCLSLGLARTSLAGENPAPPSGEYWLAELGCTACHSVSAAVEARLSPKAAPALLDIGARMTRAELARFVQDPQHSKPHSEMPRFFAAEPSAEERAVIADIVEYLSSLGGPRQPERRVLSLEELEQGRQLYHQLGCIACHGAHEERTDLQSPFWELEAPEVGEASWASPTHPFADLLERMDTRWTHEALTDFLRDPLQLLPSGRMPSLGLTPSEAGTLASYLLGRGLLYPSTPWPEVQGLAYEYYEASFAGTVGDLEDLHPVAAGVIADLEQLPPHREDQFGFRFRGFLSVPEAGEYEFFLRSDDGSRLWIDGELLIDNDGDHAPTEKRGRTRLKQGKHAFILSFYENSGGEDLRLRWQGPQFERRALLPTELSHAQIALGEELPAEAAPQIERARAGRMHFERLGCAACHEDQGQGGGPARALLECDPGPNLKEARGCLAELPAPGLPQYAWPSGVRAALLTRLQARQELAQAQKPEEVLAARFERLACGTCHSRAEVSAGPARTLWPYFLTHGNAELGDEGRIPPDLDRVGSKLREPWLKAVLGDEARARPYMATRMPNFGLQHAQVLADLFLQIDAPPDHAREPEFSLEAVEQGRRLVGTSGLGCIQCHTFAGRASLGVPAVDLADVYERIQPEWFHELLLNPARFNQGTRMPLFWLDGKSPVRDVCGGDPSAQIRAIWTYLSLGQSAPLPEGLVLEASSYELVPDQRVRSIGVFMEGLSPRTIAVGFPENVHYAFDVQNSRLAQVWRGRFFQAEGTWAGRAGELERPPVQEVFELPRGVPFALLAVEEDPWPAELDAEKLGYRASGRSVDAQGRPRFHYRLGSIEIEEAPEAVLMRGGSALVRKFRIRAEHPHKNLWFRAAQAERIEADDGGWKTASGGMLRILTPTPAQVRQNPEEAELLLHVQDWVQLVDENRYLATVALELRW